MLLRLFLCVCSLALLRGVHSTTSQTFTDIAVDCNVNAAVLAINATALAQTYPDLDPGSLYVGQSFDQSKCRSDEGPRGTRLFHMAFGECNPEIHEFNEGGVRVSYTVRAKRRINDADSENDDVASEIRLKTSCVLPKAGLQSAKLDGGHSSLYQYVGDNTGPYQFQMTVYKDAFMTNTLDPDEEIPLGSPLWIGVKFNRNARSEMYIRDCWATSTPGGDDFEHTFIRNSVIGEDDETFIPVDDVITANSYGFSFDAFMFRGSGNRVYVKCNVYVCTPEYTMEHPDICTTPTYPAFYRGERDLSMMDFSGSGSGYLSSFAELSKSSNDNTQVQSRRKRDVSEEEEEEVNEVDAGEENENESENFEEDESKMDYRDDEEEKSPKSNDASGSGSGSGSRAQGSDAGDDEESEDGSGGSGSGSGSGEKPDASDPDDGVADTSLRFEADSLERHKEFPVFYVMHSFRVKHTDRKRKSTSSSRVYPKRTLYSTIRNGITLGIIIASTAMISACAVLLPLLFSGEKMRCLHVKPVKRVI